jgi:hypothetical protein
MADRIGFGEGDTFIKSPKLNVDFGVDVEWVGDCGGGETGRSGPRGVRRPKSEYDGSGFGKRIRPGTDELGIDLRLVRAGEGEVARKSINSAAVASSTGGGFGVVARSGYDCEPCDATSVCCEDDDGLGEWA